MKSLKILSILLLALVFSNCSDDSKGQKGYSGDNYLIFDQTERKMGVKPDTGVQDHKLTFGSLKPSSSSYQVKLVYDAASSTAIPGVDFDIVNDVITVEAGQVFGAFDVKVYENTAISAGKKAYFTLESDQYENTMYDNVVEVTFYLSCQVDLDVFPLKYDVEVFAFDEQAPNHKQTFKVVEDVENTFTVESTWGPNFVGFATGDPAYNGQFPYPATIILNCDNTVTVKAAAPNYLGGSGTYDPETGVIDVVINQGVFSSAFTTQVVFYPSEEQ